MNIQDFVSEALRQISSGVATATSSKGIEISPRPIGSSHSSTAVGHMVAQGGKLIVLVEFDLSVAVQAKIEGEVGGGLMLLGIGGKADVTTGIDQTRVQRVKFHVPVVFRPQTDDPAA